MFLYRYSYLSSSLPEHSIVFSLSLPSFYLLLLHLYSLSLSLSLPLSLSLYATAIPPALSPSLYLDLFLPLIRFCLPPPPTLAYTLANPVSLLSLSLHPFCWPPLAQCHTFSHKWSPLWFETHTHSFSPPPPKKTVFSPQYAPYRIFDLHGGVMTVYLSPWREWERSALLVYSWLCFERSAKLAVPLPEQIHDSAQMWEAQIPLLASCAVVEKDVNFRVCVCVCVCVCVWPRLPVCVNVCVCLLIAGLAFVQVKTLCILGFYH